LLPIVLPALLPVLLLLLLLPAAPAMALDLASPLIPGGFMIMASLGSVARAMVREGQRGHPAAVSFNSCIYQGLLSGCNRTAFGSFMLTC
jgi:hypothetical protein